MNSAIQLYNGDLTLISKPLPKLVHPSDVVVKVSYCGVSKTNLRIIDGHLPSPRRLIQGHEISGFVSEVGKSVKHLKIGDRVCVNPYNYCTLCHYCCHGQPQFCVNDGTKTALGYMKDGGWQQYCIVPSKLCHLLPTAMPIKISVLCQPYSSILQGWDNMGKIEQDSKILVSGADLNGLLWLCLFHFRGHRDVTVAQVSENQKSIISNLNLGFSICSMDSIVNESVTNAGNAVWGYDVIVDCTGNKKTIESQVKCLRKGATFVLYGISNKSSEISIDASQIYQKGIKIVSSHLSRFSFTRTIHLVHTMSNRYLDFKSLNVGVYNLQDYEAAINSLRKGLISKAVFEL